MKLAAKYDIEAPVDVVFGQLTDFPAWERMAMRRGADVTRHEGQSRLGMTWDVSFSLRGRQRQLQLTLASAVPNSQLTVTGTSLPVEGELTFDLLDLTASRTRVHARLQVKPRTLAARLYFQTLRLAKRKLDASFAQRLAHLALEIEDRYRRPTSLRG